MAIGINSEFLDNDNDDRPLFGRHWLEDSSSISFPFETIKKEMLLKYIINLSEKDRQWLEIELEKNRVAKSRKAFKELQNKHLKKLK